jgi:hypothetical protein
VSNARLVLHLDRTERGVELLEEVVLLVVQGGAAEVREPQGAVEDAALVVGVLPRA